MVANVTSVLAVSYFSTAILTTPSVAQTMSDLETNMTDGFPVELHQKLSGYRDSLYPHPDLMASLNGELPSEAVMM